MDMPARQSDLDTLVRDTLRKLLHRSNRSIEQIADDLSRRVGRHISGAMLSKWSSPRKGPWRLPADCVPPLCEICDSDELALLLLSESRQLYEELGCVVADQAGSRIAELVNQLKDAGNRAMKEARRRLARRASRGKKSKK